LNFSNRLLELIIGVFIISITTVFLPRFSTLFAEQHLDTIRSDMQQIIEITAFIALPATVGVLMIGEEIVTLLFARGAFDATSVSLTAGALRYHILGLIFISWNRILLTLFQAGKWIRQTVQIAAMILIVNTVAAVIFSRSAAHLGIAGANSLSQMVQTILLVLYLHKLMKCRIGQLFSGKRLMKTFMMSILLLIGLWSFKKYMTSPEQPVLLNVSLLIGFGVILYGSSAILFKSEALKSIRDQFNFKKQS